MNLQRHQPIARHGFSWMSAWKIWRGVIQGSRLWVGLVFFVALGGRSNGQQWPAGFVGEILATNLNAVTAVAPLPDGRILIAEQTGMMRVWKEGAVLPKPALAIHVTDYWERGLIGLTVHSRFLEQPHVFVCYVTDRPFVHHVVSRFTLTGDTIDPGSERILLEGDDQEKFGGFKKAGHQGGVLRFGLDGKLYVSIGEQTAREPSQDFGMLQGSILRLNEDGTIPEDNPFLDRTAGKYRAIFAKGVRNCFGIAVQSKEDGGRMYFTDVGDSRFEEVNLLKGGANYGWPIHEGPGQDARFIAPIHAYGPTVGRSICGGLFYPRQPAFGAASFPDKWRGRFFFADWANHWIRCLDPEEPAKATTFASGLNGPVAIELMADGSMLVLNRGTIWRDEQKFVANSGSLVRIRYIGGEVLAHDRKAMPAPPAALGMPGRFEDLPRRLSELPVFGWLQDQLAGQTHSVGGSADRIRAYDLNCPPWLPGVRVRRWIALPAEKSIRFRATGEWELPVGTVQIQHFERNGSGGDELGRPLETRFLVVGGEVNYGVSYQWQENGGKATLVEDPDAVPMPGGLLWPVPAAEPYLTFPSTSLFFRPELNTRQLNRPGAGNPIRIWAKEGLIVGVPDDHAMAKLPRLMTFEDVNAEGEMEWKIRSYLDVHCAACHYPGGNGRGRFDARFETPLAEAGLINGELESGDLGIAGARVILPGQSEKSILYRRLAADDFFRMPPVQYHSLKSPILPTLRDWISGMK